MIDTIKCRKWIVRRFFLNCTDKNIRFYSCWELFELNSFHQLKKQFFHEIEEVVLKFRLKGKSADAFPFSCLILFTFGFKLWFRYLNLWLPRKSRLNWTQKLGLIKTVGSCTNLSSIDFLFEHSLILLIRKTLFPSRLSHLTRFFIVWLAK